MFFFVLWYIISTTLPQIHISLRFPTHPFKSVYWCSRKSLFGLSEASVVLWENNCPENFHIVPSEKSSAESFLSTLAGPPGTFLKSSLEQLFCRESVSNCFCKRELRSIRYLGSFPAGGCNVKAYNLL